MRTKHQSKKVETSTVPAVRVGYMFMSEASGKEGKDAGMTIIVMAYRNSDYTFIRGHGPRDRRIR